ncbi:MAG: tRNA pseudouridine(38-40) synthase TruA [Fibrobacter sp.]|nr:tRNA pseudouridine(38-40) synthase TruA [Fibrobacter sp.]
MKRYYFEIEYLGSGFAGWQVQKDSNLATVQGELEKAFSLVMQERIKVTGAGRTDAGVHALGQAAHCDLPAKVGDLKKLELSINAVADKKLCIRNLQEVDGEFHARYNASSRYYTYRIYSEPTAIYKGLGWEARGSLDFAKMAQEARSFVGSHDFEDFCVPRNDGKSTKGTISRFELEYSSEPGLGAVFHIQGNRFLHKQIRAMVGLLYDVGRKRYGSGAVNQVFEKKFKGERTWAPPQGLCLQKVYYPQLELK